MRFNLDYGSGQKAGIADIRGLAGKKNLSVLCRIISGLENPAYRSFRGNVISDIADLDRRRKKIVGVRRARARLLEELQSVENRGRDAGQKKERAVESWGGQHDVLRDCRPGQSVATIWYSKEL